MNGSKNEGESAECKNLYSSVQEQGPAQVLITILVSDHSLVFELTLPTICINEKSLPRILFLMRTCETNSTLKMRIAVRGLGGINMTTYLRHIKHFLRYKNFIAPNKRSCNNSLGNNSQTY